MTSTERPAHQGMVVVGGEAPQVLDHGLAFERLDDMR
jgi:hypothetical protein